MTSPDDLTPWTLSYSAGGAVSVVSVLVQSNTLPRLTSLSSKSRDPCDRLGLEYFKDVL